MTSTIARILAISLLIAGACAQAGPDFGGDSSDASPTPDKPDAGPGPGRETNCIDGMDEDNDGLRDCADPDCAGIVQCMPETDCTNGVDDNADGKADCADDDCNGVGACESGSERTCDDGIDNDGDGATDCADPDCAPLPVCVPETNCQNGVDDEGDGRTDCADVDCDGVGACEFGTEQSCTDGIDNDGDGQTDCGDPDCAVLASCVISCPPGTTAAAASAGSVPTTIPDFGNANITASMAASGAISSALVRIDLPHEFTGDLSLTLIAPDGTEIELSSGNGGFGPGYVATIFDDAASTPITSAVSPFTGRFRPEQPLSALVGKSAGGTWRLAVADQAPFWTGSVESFSVYACACTGPDCEVGSACSDGVDNDGDGDADCDDSGCADEVVCTPGGETVETTCNDGLDNDGNGQTDCDDAACGLTCMMSGCPGGQVEYQFRAEDVPVAIADLATATSTIAAAKPGTASRIGVRVSLTHTYDADLIVTLRGPGGAAVELTSGNGDGGDNYTATVFADAASTPITGGSPPFSGAFRPEQPLAGANGQSVSGMWRLDIEDTAGGDTGTLTSFELAMCATP